ncbi:MAG: hypothetical protein ACHQT9_01240 [Candidatus Saccharimonadales bacterium]
MANSDDAILYRIMELSPHKPSEPHPWELMARDVIPRPLPTPVPEASMHPHPFEFPEPQGVNGAAVPPARRIINHVMLPGPKNGWR